MRCQRLLGSCRCRAGDGIDVSGGVAEISEGKVGTADDDDRLMFDVALTEQLAIPVLVMALIVISYCFLLEDVDGIRRLRARRGYGFARVGAGCR